jgi:hypothetical protein
LYSNQTILNEEHDMLSNKLEGITNTPISNNGLVNLNGHLLSMKIDSVDCIDSVNYIIDLLCDEKKQIKDNHVKNDEKTFIEHPIIKDLFDEKLTHDYLSNHKIYSIFHWSPKHKYIIEKKWDKNKFVYKLHQSWLDEFTLGQWEGVVPWDEKSRLNIFQRKDMSFFEKYRGKILSVEEVKQFLIEMIKLCNLCLSRETMTMDCSEEWVEQGSHSVITSNPVDKDKLLSFNKTIAKLRKSDSSRFKIFKSRSEREIMQNQNQKNCCIIL